MKEYLVNFALMLTISKEFQQLWVKGIPDKSTQEFIAHNRNKWGWNQKKLKQRKSVVLVSLYNWKPALYCFSQVSNYLAEAYDARIEAFSFTKSKDSILEKVYASFGAKTNLTYKQAEAFKAQAASLADQIFENLSSKEDVLKITIDGIAIGDLIYNTYLRTLVQPTVDIQDARLKKIILKAIMVFYASQKYLAENNVIAFFPDHTVYLEPGILTRLAYIKQIPVYLNAHRPVYLLVRLDPKLSSGMPNPLKRWPYYKFRDDFKNLSPEHQAKGLIKAREALAQRLDGKVDNLVLHEFSAYAKEQESTQRVLSTSDKPKMLILLHDFCDSVHCYRSMLFPDFYEWANFLLEKASTTDFEWYVKPHPNSFLNPKKNATNTDVVEELKRRFPKIHFLDPTVSNKQLVKEGIQVMFNVHGTAGHEFAYLGVPVVNAGDNLHINYEFNIHPADLAEYEKYILNAHQIQASINPLDVEEFFYMQYFHYVDQCYFPNAEVDLSELDQPGFLAIAKESQAYRNLIELDNAMVNEQFQNYYRYYFNNTVE